MLLLMLVLLLASCDQLVQGTIAVHNVTSDTWDRF
jgi:hypothetical protein